MKKIYFANTNFEFELLSHKEANPFHEIKKYPICLQLQFLPLLFANEEDEVLVVGQPENEFLRELKHNKMAIPRLITEKEIDGGELVTWGWSKALKDWADTKPQLTYNMPDWEVVRKVNSKEWSFNHSLKLPGAQLLYSMDDLCHWVALQKGHKGVLKTCYGLSGRGHLLLQPIGAINNKMKSFCQREWLGRRPVIAEPWVERLLDFSTLWHLSSDQIQFMAATKMINQPQGSYQGSLIGDENLIFQEFPGLIQQQKKYSISILESLKKEGYFGFVGIDAMVYRYNGKECIHPIVEINARMTMALAGFLMQKKHFLNKNICLLYEKNGLGLLPKHLLLEDKQYSFDKQLKIKELIF